MTHTDTAVRPTDVTFESVVAGLTATVRTPEAAPPTHRHDRTCWWDVSACRWAGAAHPDPRAPRP